jgi:hypothetical protein
MNSNQYPSQMTFNCNCCGKKVLANKAWTNEGGHAHLSCVRYIKKAQAMMGRIQAARA